jgi:hypothetical protein
VVIYAHVRPDQAMVEVDNTRSVITPEHLQEWCQQAGTTVTVKPVIDLNEEITTNGYQPTEKQREQTRLRWPTCPFPYCDRPSWRLGPNADNDHVTEWPEGATTTSNLAPPRLSHESRVSRWIQRGCGRNGRGRESALGRCRSVDVDASLGEGLAA